MKKIEGGLESVPGYRFSSIMCGIRYDNRLDYSLIMSDAPCVASGLFTTNKIFAAPVRLCRERINNKIRGILINSTNANACTGETGYSNAAALTEDIAVRTGTEGKSILMASTGIIGRQLPSDKMKDSHDELLKNLSSENGSLIPKAIMTTDTFPKSSACAFTAAGKEFFIAGAAKGSGMIAPDMATLLAFILTDAPVAKKDLDESFRRAVNDSFNSITIDGDMSTNDTAIILSPDLPEKIDPADLNDFRLALNAVLDDLAILLVKDGEGATKLVQVKVINAASEADARLAAKSISESLLVKTAIFGNDPNWGRVAAAAGRSGAAVEESRLSVAFDETEVLKKGTPVDIEYAVLKEIMDKREYTITVDLGLGNGTAKFYTTDISYDYIKINAEYST